MAHLAACVDSLDPIKRHQETILMSLRDKDISVRRRGLDLLYSMCDTSNAKIIVSELLRYLQVADYAMREEMVLKIAILAEKFATAYSWYVDIILQLISTAGDQVGEEVWYRIVQIVTNNEELQEYAAKTVLHYLESPQYNETMVKVGAYILGEFGHLIANYPGCSPIEQFNAVHSKFNLCSLQTRALMLTTYIKFVNLFPEIKGQVLNVFNQYRYVLDSELQQRACEYLALSTMPTDDLLQTVCEEMPPFPERESNLLLKLNQKHSDTEDKRVWVVGGKEANAEQQDGLKRIATLRSNSYNETKTSSSSVAQITAGPPSAPARAASDSGMITRDLVGFNDLSLEDNSSPPILKALPTNIPLAPGYELGYNRLLYATEGVLYEDNQLQVSMKSEYHNQQGRIAIYISNKLSLPMTQVTVQVSSDDSFQSNIAPPHQHTITPGAQIQRLVQIECLDVFTESPSLFIGFNDHQQHMVHLKLPVILTKFQEPINDMDGENFFKRWNQIGGPPRETQAIFPSKVSIKLDKVNNLLRGFRFGLLQGVDPNPNNFVGVGVIHAGSKGGKIGALIRLEPNLEQNVSEKERKKKK